VDTRTGRIFVSNWGDFAVSPRRPDVDMFKGGNTITVLDTRSGRHVGTIHVNGNPSAMAVNERTGRVFVYSDGDGFPGYTKLVSTLDGTSGRRLRAVVVAHDPRGRNPSQGAGDIVVDDQSGRVFVSSPYADSVSMLDATSGRRLRTVGGTHPGPMAVDTHTRRVFVTSLGAMDAAGHLTGPGSVSVLDAQSGMLLRTVPVGVEPAVIAVDERAGRAFVVNVAGDSHDALAAARSLVPGLAQPAPPCNSYGQVSTRCRLAPGSVTVLDATR